MAPRTKAAQEGEENTGGVATAESDPDSYVLYGPCSVTPAVSLDSNLVGNDQLPLETEDKDGVAVPLPPFPKQVKVTVTVDEVINLTGLPTKLAVVLRTAPKDEGVPSVIVDTVEIAGQGEYALSGEITGPFDLTSRVVEGQSTYNLHAEATLS